jgi:NTE family protein
MNTKPQKLSPETVRYLSFEGGGGKGPTYLGALAAFAHPEIGLLRHDAATDDYHLRRWTGPDEPGISGVSGASVGAITASLLASGWGVNALYADVVSNRAALGSFFDPTEATRRNSPAEATVGGSLARVVEVLSRNPAVRQFFEHPTGHLQDLWVDYGLFAGRAGQSFVETSIRNGEFVARETVSGSEHAAESEGEMTFHEHRERSGSSSY